MALFKCSTCKLLYEDYYPPDDTCLICKRGTVRIVQKLIPTEMETIMKISYVEKITLVMCESCFDLIIEENSQELKGTSYCPDCISENSNSN